MNDDADQTSQRKRVLAARSAKLHRISGVDAIVTEEVLLLAAHGLNPFEKTQRTLFGEQMPTIFILHEKERYTFKRITSLLKNCGFNLTESTVRSYYASFLSKHENEYIKVMDENMALWAQISKETMGMELSAIAGKVAEIIERKRVQDDF